MRDEILKDMLQNASKENPVTRQKIKDTFLVSDRVGRDMITELRKKGMRICTNLSTGGYWSAKSEEDYQEFRKQYISYPLDTLDTIKKMDNQGQEDEGQVTMNGII